nr:unnamed protein product [Digitaria exilis]
MAPPAAPSSSSSSSARVILAAPQSPPLTLLQLRGVRRRTVGLARRGGGDGCARLLVVRRGAADEEAGATARGQQEVEESVEDPVPGRDLVTLAACLVGLLTGVSVVLFNLSVHEIRDIFWDGIPSRGASWLREEPISEVWQRVVFVPVTGGVIVGGLNTLRSSIKTSSNGPVSKIKSAFRPFLKAVAASFTLGTGNSLGPEGPSVEIGSAVAKGFGNVFEWNEGKRLSLVAAGSAAGISSGFSAAVAGCFFAVESVLWTSSTDSSSLANSTPMVILSSVIASVISEIGLGSDPAFTVPEYDFRSPTGMAYGKFMRFTFTGPEPLLHVPFLDVASPQAYGLVGMAATLAGVCKVPLTSVLLLFELTQDYRIVLPLLGAVGVSSWIASPQRFSKRIRSKLDSLEEKSSIARQANNMTTQKKLVSMDTADSSQELSQIESSLCVYDANDENLFGNLTVAEAMKTNYFSVSMTTPVVEALDLMLAEKQPFVMVKEFLVSHIHQVGKFNSCSVTPQMSLTTAEKIMDSHGVDHLPVVSEHANLQDRGLLIGFVDKECIAIARRM